MNRRIFLQIAAALGVTAGLGWALGIPKAFFQPARPTKKQISRARRLHQEAIVIIAHDHRFLLQDFEDTRAGGVTAKVVKITTDGIDWDPKTRERVFISQLDGWRRRHVHYMQQIESLIASKANNLIQVLGVDDIFRAKREGKTGVVFGSEGLRYLEGDINAVEEFYKLGVREMQLYWPAGNQAFADGHLTEFGRQVIAECNRLGILVDISHTAQASRYAVEEVIAATKAPLIISHEAPRHQATGMIGDPATDDLIQAIVGSGGGHGVFAMHFVTPGYITNKQDPQAPATMDDLVADIAYVVNLVGIDHVALGGDWFNEVTPKGPSWHWVVPNISQLPDLTLALVRHGFSDEEIRKILGLNMLRLFEKVW
jgi:membrane dipeptidase